MSDQTPRVPDLRWSAKESAVYADREGAAPRYIQLHDTKRFELPADAVELGDVEALRAEIVGAWCALTDGERDEIEDLAPGLHQLLERLTGDVNRSIVNGEQAWAILDREPGREELKWTCARCGAGRWVGWRAGPAHEGYPRKAQCVPCGHVQELPVSTQDSDPGPDDPHAPYWPVKGAS